MLKLLRRCNAKIKKLRHSVSSMMTHCCWSPCCPAVASRLGWVFVSGCSGSAEHVCSVSTVYSVYTDIVYTGHTPLKQLWTFCTLLPNICSKGWMIRLLCVCSKRIKGFSYTPFHLELLKVKTDLEFWVFELFSVTLIIQMLDTGAIINVNISPSPSH